MLRTRILHSHGEALVWSSNAQYLNGYAQGSVRLDLLGLQHCTCMASSPSRPCAPVLTCWVDSAMTARAKALRTILSKVDGLYRGQRAESQL